MIKLLVLNSVWEVPVRIAIDELCAEDMMMRMLLDSRFMLFTLTSDGSMRNVN